MISLLLPSRGRAELLKRFYESAMETADSPLYVEVVVYVDNDDYDYNFSLPRLRWVRGDRIVLSEMWNKCYEMALGEIYGHMGDDIIFRTKGWDTAIKNAMRTYEDRIAFVHGDDGSDVHRANFGTHGFLHKNWIDTVGYFVPPYFSSDYNDTWLNDVANMIDRRIYLPDVLTEHMHYVFGKSPMDNTYSERIERGNADKVDEIYSAKHQERVDDAMKLQEYIDKHK